MQTKRGNFYNTINLEGATKFEAEQKALTQEQRILRFFIQCRPGGSMAPSAVHDRVFDKEILLTSVRRAMSSLTKSGDLVKSHVMIIGPYGKPEHLWNVSAKWSTETPVQGELL